MRADAQIATLLRSFTTASSASQSSQALSTIASRTGSDIGRRGSDHLKDLAAAGLVGQRLLSSSVCACTSSNSRTFSMAMTAWSAKVRTNCYVVSSKSARVPLTRER